MCTSESRHAWLEAARIESERLLANAGYVTPAQVRVSIGFAFASRKAIGQCWSSESSSDAHAEIVISPVMDDSEQILGVIIHELIHAIAGHQAGHGPGFKKIALAVGLAGKMTATIVGPILAPRLQQWIARNGAYPAGKVDPGATRKKQGTRLLKALCGECGYTVRVTAKWAAVGSPHCPDHGEMDLE